MRNKIEGSNKYLWISAHDYLQQKINYELEGLENKKIHNFQIFKEDFVLFMVFILLVYSKLNRVGDIKLMFLPIRSKIDDKNLKDIEENLKLLSKFIQKWFNKH